MNVPEVVRAALLASDELTALVGQRVRPDQAGDKDAFPFIVFRRTSGKRDAGLDGTWLGSMHLVEIECWHEQRTKADEMAELVAQALRDAGIQVDDNDPDAVDPELIKRCAVITCTLHEDPP